MNKKILVLDIETTGFLNNNGKIVEIGIVELDLSNGNVKTLFDKVMHERPITREEVENSWIVKNSSLTVEEIQNSKQLVEYKPEIQEILNQYTDGCTAFNNTFDFGFLDSRGFYFPKKLACPMRISTNICKLPHRNGGRGYKWPTVEEAYKFFFGGMAEEYVELHRGADDAAHEAQIVYELFLRGIFKV